MASNKGFSLLHPYYTVLIGVLLLIGLAFLVRSVLFPTVFEQHASIDQFNAIAVKGSVYVDKNRNGKRDPGEVNFTGTPQGHVKLALFENSCNPTPSTKPSMTPIPPTGVVTPTLPSGCFYRKLCPMGILCRGGSNPFCPPCKDQLICPPPGQPQPVIPSAQGVTVVPIQGGSIKNVKGVADAATQGEDQNDLKTAQAEDVCRRLPTRVITCPVAPDGTYACTAQNVQFTEAWVKLYEPARYISTSPNPVLIKTATATVDFGIALFFQPVGTGR